MEKVIKELAYLFRATRNTRPVLLLGAGASYRSGIPMAGKAIEHIARAAYSRQILGVDEKLGNPKPSDWLPFLQWQPWFVSDSKRFTDNFPLAVENLLRPTEFRREFFTEMIKPLNGVNTGYRYLAKLMMRRLCQTAMTTNFDHNIVEALRELHSHIPEIVEVPFIVYLPAYTLLNLFIRPHKGLHCLEKQRCKLALGRPSMYTEKLNPDNLPALVKVEDDPRPYLF